MKIVDGETNRLVIEIDSEEAIGLFLSMLYLLDQIKGEDFQTLLHFRRDKAYKIMKQLQAAKVNFSLSEDVT